MADNPAYLVWILTPGQGAGINAAFGSEQEAQTWADEGCGGALDEGETAVVQRADYRPNLDGGAGLMAEPQAPLPERFSAAVMHCADSLASGKVTIDAQLAQEAVRGLELGRAAYRGCMSAWAAGEPKHRVEAMIAAVEALGTSLGEPGAPKAVADAEARR